jgi:hypothetical protein
LDKPRIVGFVQTKFFDNTFTLESVWSGEYSETVINASLDKNVSLLPRLFLRLLGLNLDEAELNFSMGDLLYTPKFGRFLCYYFTGS